MGCFPEAGVMEAELSKENIEIQIKIKKCRKSQSLGGEAFYLSNQSPVVQRSFVTFS